ncbi:MAG: hypothetical protein AAGM67_13535, partial [Bacteroidota bacterium]
QNAFDSLYLGINTSDKGLNGPFSSLSFSLPTVSGTWFSGTPGQTTPISSLPAAFAQTSSSIDTATVTIEWIASSTGAAGMLELDLYAHDDIRYNFLFPSAGNTGRAYHATQIFIGYPQPNLVQVNGSISNLVTITWDNPAGDSATAFNVWYQPLADDGFLGEYDCFKTPEEAGYQFLGQVDSAGANEFIHSPPTGLLDTTICYLVTAVYGDPAEPRGESCGSQACLEN